MSAGAVQWAPTAAAAAATVVPGQQWPLCASVIMSLHRSMDGGGAVWPCLPNHLTKGRVPPDSVGGSTLRFLSLVLP